MYSNTIVVLLLVSAVFLDTGAAQTQQVDDSLKNGLESYISLNKQRYANVTSDMDQTLDEFRKTFSTEIATIDKQSTLLEKRINQEKANLNNLEVISAKSRTCVRNYRDNLPTSSSVERSFAQCKSSISYSVDNYLAPAESTKTTLATYYSSTLERSLNSCKNNYPIETNAEKYKNCVQNAIGAADKVTIEKQNTFDNQVEKAKCSAESDLKTYLDCTFAVEYKTVTELSDNTMKINNCIDGTNNQTNCPVCNESNSTITTKCYFRFGVEVEAADAKNAYVKNPFLSVREEACVELQIT